MSVAAVPSVKRRQTRLHEPATRALKTTPTLVAVVELEVEEHNHVAEFDDRGNGWTTTAGFPLHRHRIKGFELARVWGHTHDLTPTRVFLKAKAKRVRRR